MLESIIGYGIGNIIANIFTVLFTVAAIVGGVILYCTVFSKKNDGKYSGFAGKLYDFVNFKKLSVEPLLKLTYIILALHYTLNAFLGYRSGVFSGFSNMLIKIVIYNAVLRLIFELAMLFVRGMKRLNEINAKLEGDASGVNGEFESELFFEKNAAPKASQPVQPVQYTQPVSQPMSQPVPQPVPQPVQPVPQAVPQPVQPVPQAVPQPVQPVPQPIPQPVQSVPQPVPQPVQPVPQPIPQPVQPAPVENASVEAVPEMVHCASCGKEIKAGARFCPFCGTSR